MGVKISHDDVFFHRSFCSRISMVNTVTKMSGLLSHLACMCVASSVSIGNV